jgi:hypothetical protein
MTMPAIDREELRALVRAALRELAPELAAQRAPEPQPEPHAETPLPVDRPTTPLTAPPQDRPAALRAALPATSSASSTSSPAPAAASDDPDVVVLRGDADLDAFVRRLAKLLDNPRHRADILAGRRRFRLAGTQTGTVSSAAQRVERGAVTEAQVKRAAEAGAHLVLGRRAVLTPLARDRARALGVVVEKER